MVKCESKPKDRTMSTEVKTEKITVELTIEQARLLRAAAGYDGKSVEEPAAEAIVASLAGFVDVLPKDLNATH